MVVIKQFKAADAKGALEAEDVSKHLGTDMINEVLQFICNKSTDESEVTLGISTAWDCYTTTVKVVISPENIEGYFADSDSYRKSCETDEFQADRNGAEWHRNI